MATATDVLSIARGELGYDRFQDPEQGTKYGREYAEEHGAYFGTTGVPYCAMFASYCLKHAGVSCAGMPAASTTAIKRAAVAAGKTRASVRDAQPGDVLLISWSADDTDLDHTCLCEANCGGYVQTIEGNVGGGKVQRRTRDWKYVRYAVMPDYDGEAIPDAPAWEPQPEQDGGVPAGCIDPPVTILAYDEWFGPLTVKYVQWRLQRAGLYLRHHVTGERLIVDGVFGPETKYWLMKYLRYVCGTYHRNCDYDFGYYATCALEQHLANVGCYWKSGYGVCDIDGDWGVQLTTAAQRAINAGVF